MAAKKKSQDKYTPEQMKKIRTSMSTRQPSATVGKPTVDPAKGKAPTYKNNQKAFDALNWAGKTAAESVALGAGGAALVRGATKLAAKGAGRYVGNVAAEEAYKVNMKGLWNASGMGGKVSRTQTPMGPTLRSTAIGTPKQQAARIGNLEIGAVKRADRTGVGAQSQVIRDIFKAGNKVKQAGTTLGGAAVVKRNKPKKK
jgi:hypothetical protein